MKTQVKEKGLYIQTIAVGVRDKNDSNRTELTMICPRISLEIRVRLKAITSVQVRIADEEHEIAAFNELGEYLGPLLYDKGYSALGAVAKLLKLLERSAEIDLRLFSMGEPDISYVRRVEGSLVTDAGEFLPIVQTAKAA